VSAVATAACAVATLVAGNSGSLERQIGVEDMKTTTLMCGGLPLRASQRPTMATDLESCSSAEHSVKGSHDPDVADGLSWLRAWWAAPW
jgi:hypothetical protein